MQKKPTEQKGGVLLSGTHIETCIQDSQFLRLFKVPTRDNVALDDNAYKLFRQEQENSKETIESLLGKTLK